MNISRNYFSVGISMQLALAILLVGLMGCSPKGLEVELTNTLDQSRPDAQVVIQRDSLAKYDQQLAQSEAFEIVDNSQSSIPYQLDDIDGDGQWDELALVYSLPANGSSSIYLRSYEDDVVQSYQDRTQVWFAEWDSSSSGYKELQFEIRPDDYRRDFSQPFTYQFEGPGWENDQIGFRMYFDERNGFDIWGKRTSDLVLQDVGVDGDYHSMADWGMDILHVGNSLGAGAIGAKTGDQVLRLQGTEQEVFEEVADGPVRSVFELTYQGWTVGDSEYSVRERISIWAGADGYQNEVALVGPRDSLNLIAGMVTAKLDGEPEFGEDSPFRYVMSHGVQSANGANLGMAIVSGSDNATGYGSVDYTGESVDSTAYIEFNLTHNQPVTYQFVAGWETGAQKFRNQDRFREAVLSAGRQMQNPVVIRFVN